MSVLTVRLDDDTHKGLRTTARTHGLGVSEYVRTMLVGQAPTGGVWAITSTDYGERLEAAFPTEIEALREVVNRGYGSVIFIRWGEDILDARTREKAEASE